MKSDVLWRKIVPVGLDSKRSLIGKLYCIKIVFFPFQAKFGVPTLNCVNFQITLGNTSSLRSNREMARQILELINCLTLKTYSTENYYKL